MYSSALESLAERAILHRVEEDEKKVEDGAQAEKVGKNEAEAVKTKERSLADTHKAIQAEKAAQSRRAYFSYFFIGKLAAPTP